MQRSGRRGAAGGALPGAILAAALLAALLLVVAEFTTLFSVRDAVSPKPVKSVSTGSHHAYAMIPIALAAALLAYAFFRGGSRPALLGVGVLGIIALLIALVGDLPDAHASGLVGSPATRFAVASSTPSAGMYMETLGAVLLMLTCGVGFLLLGPSAPGPARGTAPRSAS